MKLTLAFLLLGAFVAANAQFGPFGFGGGFPTSQFYLTLLERRVQTMLATPDFPEDLQVRALDEVANATARFEQCESAAYPMPWMQKVCITREYSRAQNALKAIEDEAAARAQAAASTTSAAPAA